MVAQFPLYFVALNIGFHMLWNNLRWSMNHHMLEYLLLDLSLIVSVTTAIDEKTLSAMKIIKNEL